MKKIVALVLSALFLLSGCGSPKKYAASVGDIKISLDEMNFYLKSVKSQMEGTELSSDEDWQTKEIEGRRAIELAKEKALETAINNIKYIEIGKALGIKLNSDNKKNIDTYKSRFKSQFGSSDEYKNYLKTNSIDESFIDMLCESMFYQSKLTDKIKEEEPVTEGDISDYFNENNEELEHEYRHAKHILILTKDMQTGEEFSEDKAEEAKKKAEDILKRARSGEDFDKLAQEFSEDPGLQSQPDGYVFGDGEMVQEFQDGVDALDANEIGFVKSSFGYHILLRCPLTLNDVKDKISDMIIAEKLNRKISEWTDEYKINVEINDEVTAELK